MTKILFILNVLWLTLKALPEQYVDWAVSPTRPGFESFILLFVPIMSIICAIVISLALVLI